jgi:hypothetical protein
MDIIDLPKPGEGGFPMHRSLPMKFRCLASLFVAAGLAASTAAWACPDSKVSGVSATIPTAEPEIVLLAANTNQDAGSDAPAPGPVSPHARFKDADHLIERPVSWLFIGSSGPKSGAHQSGTERISRAIDHRGTTSESRSKAAGVRRSRPVGGDYESHVAKPHRMPAPEIL